MDKETKALQRVLVQAEKLSIKLEDAIYTFSNLATLAKVHGYHFDINFLNEKKALDKTIQRYYEIHDRIEE